jgi:hypothetical protein
VQSVQLLHEWQDVQSSRKVSASCPLFTIFERDIMGWEVVPVQFVQLWHFLHPVQLVLPWSLGARDFSVKLPAAEEDVLEGRQPMITVRSSMIR